MPEEIPQEKKTKKEIKIQDLKPKENPKGGGTSGGAGKIQGSKPGIVLPGSSGIPF